MPTELSPRLLAVVNALPLAPGMRVLEIGCGSVAVRVGALDGRRPAAGEKALPRIAAALKR